MPFKKKKSSLKYTETPEFNTDGNPSMPNPPITPPFSTPQPPIMDEGVQEPPKRMMTELELNGYFGSNVMVFFTELLALENKILSVLEKNLILQASLLEEVREENDGN